MHKTNIIPFPHCPTAEPKPSLEQRVGEILANATPKLPEHEALAALKKLDAKLDQVLYLLRRKGVN